MALKIWGGSLDGKNRFCMAATSLAAVKRAIDATRFNASLHYLRNYWSRTHNSDEIAAATASPNVLLIEQPRYSGTYVPYAEARASINDEPNPVPGI